MSQTHKLVLPTPVVICYTTVLAISFFMTIALGIWMNDCVENLDFALAYKLKLAHLASGTAFILLALFHAWYNRGYVKAIFSTENSTWKQHAYQRVIPLFILAFIAVAVSAVLILCGVRSVVPFHCGVALLFAVLGIFHITLNISSRK